MNCENCGKKIPKERMEAMPDAIHCVGCAEKHGAQPHAFMVFGHKTASEIVIVDKKDDEAMRLAERAHKRSR